MKQVIINADDFGLTKSATMAIAQSLKNGLVTDTTMVANGLAFDEAISLIEKEKLDGRVGIHFNLTEGTPLINAMRDDTFFTCNGIYHDQIRRYKAMPKNTEQILYEELSAQVRKLKSAGVHITHADSHHHIHTAPFIAKILFRVCDENDIKAIRIHRNYGNIPAYKRCLKSVYNLYAGTKYTTTNYFCGLDDLSKALPDGITEIMVHPDYNDAYQIIDRRGEERLVNLEEQIHLLDGCHRLTYKELLNI